MHDAPLLIHHGIFGQGVKAQNLQVLVSICLCLMLHSLHETAVELLVIYGCQIGNQI